MKPITTAMLIGLMTGPTLFPNAAQAQEVVQFEYLRSELQSLEGRQYLVKRIKTEARSVCRDGAMPPYYAPPKTCRQDLEAQWLVAIGSPALSTHLQSNGIKLADARP